jgi:ligand-binding sensor domain-containing protein
MIYSAMIVQTPDGTVWAGHNDGLTAFDADGSEICTFGAPEIPGGRVNALLATENGLWCGSQEGAAYLTSEKGEWTVEEILTTENGLAESVVQVITQVGDEIWFGSYLGEDRGGISIRGADGWSYLSTEDGIPHRYINAILALSEDRVLIGSGQLIQGGLSLAKRGPEGWYIAENWNQEDGIPGMKVRWLYQDSAGRLWITTEADGLLILDSPEALGARPLEGEVLTQASGLMDNEVKCLVECENCFFLGGKYGMTRFDKE